jgi:hypothetical protein
MNISLTKTCSVCGQQKPLSAFLQLAGPKQGTVYGNICSACRKTQVENAAPREPEEETKSTTGVKIDGKAKVQTEVENRELRKQADEDYFEKRDEKDEKQVINTEKINTIAKNEKKHRDSFIGTHRFSEKPNKPVDASKIPGSEDQKRVEGTLDFTAPVEFTRVDRVATKTAAYNTFKSWLPGSAPILSAAERTAKQKPNGNKDINSISEKIEKNRSPGSRKP